MLRQGFSGSPQRFARFLAVGVSRDADDHQRNVVAVAAPEILVDRGCRDDLQTGRLIEGASSSSRINGRLSTTIAVDARLGMGTAPDDEVSATGFATDLDASNSFRRCAALFGMVQLPAEFRPLSVLDFVIFAASKDIQGILKLLWPISSLCPPKCFINTNSKIARDCARAEAMRSRSRLLRRRSIYRGSARIRGTRSPPQSRTPTSFGLAALNLLFSILPARPSRMLLCSRCDSRKTGSGLIVRRSAEWTLSMLINPVDHFFNAAGAAPRPRPRWP